jgi:ribosomal protein L11 methyltransferase
VTARQDPEARFVAIELRARDRDTAERAAAEAYAAGALGLEERESGDGITFAIYAPAARAEAVRAALLGVEPVEVSAAARLPEVDWSEHWKRGLAPVVVSPRLMLRPSFDATPALPGQRVLVIDPGQAFGTGGHASTRLALECIDAIAPELLPRTRLLDVGTGSGVLALAALALGCGFACGLDRDRLAGEAARDNARRNRLADRLALCIGEPAALAERARFDVVAANLLLSEHLPLLPALARLADGGRLIVSGLLETQRDAWEAAAHGHGLRVERALRGADAGGAAWVALITRGSARASRATPAPA